ncbi:hypothetical protein [uncultured Ruminococcus sp.]|uniref:hypothetical protein n=1 Tax=uncultured Ruminococcus sp. TaxID=165186 RepID=UPI0025DEA99E|nr:hypothetical protein [uncultured Ruminococcus sp.]
MTDEKLIAHLLSAPTIREAAIQAGISESAVKIMGDIAADEQVSAQIRLNACDAILKHARIYDRRYNNV